MMVGVYRMLVPVFPGCQRPLFHPSLFTVGPLVGFQHGWGLPHGCQFATCRDSLNEQSPCVWVVGAAVYPRHGSDGRADFLRDLHSPTRLGTV